ncbi:hypothetical protein V6N11_062144 [Hibiscus sabdariffa]|uniref:Uncharacterized protein n=1 Tax=Hibiscus sabdariffa TaxID=183260 RepID=A0ABR2PRS2_9ROSI
MKFHIPPLVGSGRLPNALYANLVEKIRLVSHIQLGNSDLHPSSVLVPFLARVKLFLAYSYCEMIAPSGEWDWEKLRTYISTDMILRTIANCPSRAALGCDSPSWRKI